jgi:hypothetical protein
MFGAVGVEGFLVDEFLGCEAALTDGGGVEESKDGQSLFSVLEDVYGLVGGEVGEVEVLVAVDEEVGGADVTVVDVEDVVAGEHCEDHLVYHPN